MRRKATGPAAVIAGVLLAAYAFAQLDDREAGSAGVEVTDSPASGVQPTAAPAGTQAAAAVAAPMAAGITLTRVTPAGGFGSFGGYNVPPDSPDGTRIAYVRWDAVPTSSAGGDAALYLADSNLTNHRKVIDLKSLGVHNGGRMAWIDNDSIAVQNAWNGTRFGAAVVNTSTRRIEHGPWAKASMLHRAVNGKLLLFVNVTDGDLPRGLHVLDTATGTVRMIASHGSFASYAGAMAGSDDPADWLLTHATWSTGGALLAVCLETDGPDGYLFTFKPDFSDVVLFGRKPQHFGWYDSATIWGNDTLVDDGRANDNSLRRWSRSRGWIADIAAAPATHGAVADNYVVAAGETSYNSNPVALNLYRANTGTTLATLFSHNFPGVTWGLSAHVNPAFSRDGRRLFFNRAVSATMNEGWVADISAFYDVMRVQLKNDYWTGKVAKGGSTDTVSLSTDLAAQSSSWHEIPVNGRTVLLRNGYWTTKYAKAGAGGAVTLSTDRVALSSQWKKLSSTTGGYYYQNVYYPTKYLKGNADDTVTAAEGNGTLSSKWRITALSE